MMVKGIKKMCIAGIQNWCQDIQQETFTHIKVVVAALLVASAVYMIWGKFAVMCYFSIAVFAYVYFGADIRILERLDLKGLALAAAVVAAPFFGGIPAYFAGAMAGVSIIAYEWQNYGIVIQLEDTNQEVDSQNKELQAQVAALQDCERQLQQVLEQAVGSNEKLRKLWEEFDQGAQKIDQARKGHAALLGTMERFHAFYTKVTTDEWVAKDLELARKMEQDYAARQTELLRLETRIKALTAGMEATHRKNQASTDLFAERVDQFGQRVDAVQVVVEEFVTVDGEQ